MGEINATLECCNLSTICAFHWQCVKNHVHGRLNVSHELFVSCSDGKVLLRERVDCYDLDGPLHVNHLEKQLCAESESLA